ncbi:MAG TPA: DUF4394 domain-containing protein [Bryobacteraceae bacterium]|nr:DUF4394 domain-containing protein [Bryobacteraceae bacterium]
MFIGSLAPAYGGLIVLTNAQNQLLTINSATPGTILSTVGITGLQGGESILGIDFRPANGQLYGLGSTSRLYAINTATGAATQVGSAGAFTLSGTSFGFDFNPTVDRIRVISNTGQNIRLNPNDGTLAGTDTAINGGPTALVGSAYTNNFAGASSTLLYGIDANSDSLYSSLLPNTGTYTLVGSLGLDAIANVGFDIGSDGIAFAAIQTQNILAQVGAAGLYTINLGNGLATLVGQIGPSGQDITGLAIVLVPEPATFGLMGLGTAGLLYFARRRSRKN